MLLLLCVEMEMMGPALKFQVVSYLFTQFTHLDKESTGEKSGIFLAYFQSSFAVGFKEVDLNWYTPAN